MLEFARVRRAANQRRSPTREILDAQFGTDGVVVEAAWPLISFLEAIEKVRRSTHGDESGERERELWEEARELLIMWDATGLTIEEKRARITSVVQTIAFARKMDLRALSESVFDVLDRKCKSGRSFLSTFRPGTVKYAVENFWNQSVRNAARDIKKTHFEERMNAEQEHELMGFEEISSSTVRGLKHRGAITEDTPRRDVLALIDEGKRKKTHRPSTASLRTLAQLAEVWPYSETALRNQLRKEIDLTGDKPFAEGRYRSLNADWEDRILRRLGPPKGQDNFFWLARKLNVPLQVLLEVADDYRELIPHAVSADVIDPKRVRVSPELEARLNHRFRKRQV